MVRDFKANDLIREIRVEAQILKPMGAGIWNIAQDLGKVLRQIWLSYFNINVTNIENLKYYYFH